MTPRIFDMTMLTHPGSRFEPASYRSGRRDTAAPTTTLAVLKRFCLRAVGPLLAGGTVAGIIPLKAATFLSRVHY
jgi:hypothetical protein